TVSGTATDGQTLTAATGSWADSPSSYAYQWQNCDSTGTTCTNISGATSSTYVLTSNEVSTSTGNGYIRVQVTATNGVGSSTPASSAITAAVQGVAPANTSSPTISGSAIDGQLLTAGTGAWTGTTPLNFAYQWHSCTSAAPSGCSNVGTNSSTYTLASSDVNNYVYVTVTATNTCVSGCGSVSKDSAVTAQVAGVAPSSTQAPTVPANVVRQGFTLKATTGVWSGTTPLSYAYQWHACTSAAPSGCANIGTNSSSYTLTSSEVGRYVYVTVTASNTCTSGCGSASVDSIPTPAVTGLGAAYGWGHSGSGQLGTFDMSAWWSPAQVGAATTWTSIATGQYHACGVKSDGTLWCWGYNANGQLGIGSTTNQYTPTQVGAGTTWSTVTAGASFTCATKTDGTLWCWGLNTNGQIGIGSTTQQTSPAQVSVGVTTWSSVAAGTAFACATRTDGTLWCWGLNTSGQDGINSVVSPQLVPVQVGTGTTWSSVSAGSIHACAAKTDGTLWCWGSNGNGQLGIGSTTQKTSPTQVGALTTWSSVNTGANHTCATKTDNTLWCWGYDAYGQLGIGATTQQTSPVQVGAAA